MNRKIRVRFAPSPTGPLHIGGVRTALYNYLFARKNNGKFILRIEDTDQTRYVPGAEQYIMDSLEWCGIKFDEGIREGGDFGPYRQSDRKEIYRQYADRLIESGHAYYAFDTPEELEKLRFQCESEKKIFSYDCSVRGKLKNSLALPESETKKLLEQNVPVVIRFKMPENEELVFHDIIRGEIRVNTSTLDDKVLFKSDGMPTYHLANITDDHLMEISHVIRGEEWLPSLPLHIMLYKAFGWEETMPEFAHLPLLLKPSGSGKLSKRDGDKLGFPVFPLRWEAPDGEVSRGFREDGYLQGAFVNLLALMGWNPGTEKELFSMEDLVADFTLERVNKSGARFDPEKAKWFNQQYIQAASPGELSDIIKVQPEVAGLNVPYDVLLKAISLVKDRLIFPGDFMANAWFLFSAPQAYDEQMMNKRWKPETPGILEKAADIIKTTHVFDAENLEAGLKAWIESENIGFGNVMTPLRLCLVGSGTGPGLFEIMEFLGKDEVLARIRKALIR
ncbi:MAG: glutamate--tRNA ligase [Bacteroidota bacterium]